jgi:hypothetical protein
MFSFTSLFKNKQQMQLDTFVKRYNTNPTNEYFNSPITKLKISTTANAGKKEIISCMKEYEYNSKEYEVESLGNIILQCTYAGYWISCSRQEAESNKLQPLQEIPTQEFQNALQKTMKPLEKEYLKAENNFPFTKTSLELADEIISSRLPEILRTTNITNPHIKILIYYTMKLALLRGYGIGETEKQFRK